MMKQTKNEAINNASKIIIIDLLYLGDLLFATPFIRNLRKNYPQARIDMVVNSNFFSIIENNPYLDNIYAYDKKLSIAESWQFARRLNNNNYDLGLNIHGNWRTALLLKIINPDYCAGFGGKGRGIFLDYKLQPAKGVHMVEAYLQFLRKMGLKQFDDRGPELTVNKQARRRMKELLAENISEVNSGKAKSSISKKIKNNRKNNMTDNSCYRLIGFNTGGSWPTKRWTKSNFAGLADEFQAKEKNRVVFLGGPGDVERVQAIVNLMKTEPVIAAGKTTLKELAALTGKCDLVISGDSGPAHVAAAVGTPTLTIFGPSDEKKYRPYGKNHKIIKTAIDCRPCGEHQCRVGHHKCMTEIGVDDVYKLYNEEWWLD